MGSEARKTPAAGDVFFLDFPVYRTFQDVALTSATSDIHARLFRVMDSQTLRESVTGAIRYWEPRRLIYNAVLAAVVLIYFGIYYPATKSFLSIDSVLFLFLLVVLANVAYCAAYPVEQPKAVRQSVDATLSTLRRSIQNIFSGRTPGRTKDASSAWQLSHVSGNGRGKSGLSGLVAYV